MMYTISNIDMPRLEDLLGRWGHYCAMGNRNNALGIKPPLYGERVGAGAYADYSPDVDPDVLKIDAVIIKMHPAISEPLRTHYNDPRPVKTKCKGSRGAYYGRLETAKAALLDRLTESGTQNNALDAA